MTGWLLAGYMLAFAGDAVSTNVALAHGAHEAILPIHSRAGVTVVISAEAVVGVLAYRWLRPSHPRMARGLYGGLLGTHGAATAWNARQVTR